MSLISTKLRTIYQKVAEKNTTFLQTAKTHE